MAEEPEPTTWEDPPDFGPLPTELPPPEIATPLALAVLRDARLVSPEYTIQANADGKRTITPGFFHSVPDSLVVPLEEASPPSYWEVEPQMLEAWPQLPAHRRASFLIAPFLTYLSHPAVVAHEAGEADAEEAWLAQKNHTEAQTQLFDALRQEAARLDAEQGPYRGKPWSAYTPPAESPIPSLFVAFVEAEASLGRAFVAWYTARTGIEPLAPAPVKTRRRRRTGPIPQPTFHEARNPMRALQDGRTGRYWTDETQHTAAGTAPALRWKVPNDPVQVLLSPGERLDWLAVPSTHDTLRAELRAAGTPGMMLYGVCLDFAIREGQVTIDLDELAEAIGKGRREATTRREWRERVWRLLNLFDQLKVYGRRNGPWKDKKTGKVLELESDDALIKITGRRRPIQPDLDGNEPPVEVSFVAGPWLDALRGNPEVLTFFGDLRKLAAIPSGKPSGEWAQSIGLFLNQWWREQATHAPLGHTGDGNRAVVKYKPLSRRHILDKAGLLADVEALLSSPNPARAREYWEGAIRDLKAHKVIGYYEEPDKADTGRKGWQKKWLDQTLTIRPTAEDAAAAAQVNRAGKVAKAKRAKRARKDSPAEG